MAVLTRLANPILVTIDETGSNLPTESELLLHASIGQPGQRFLPRHYPEFNKLTHPSFAHHSRQPNYKVIAVSTSAA